MFDIRRAAQTTNELHELLQAVRDKGTQTVNLDRLELLLHRAIADLTDALNEKMNDGSLEPSPLTPEERDFLKDDTDDTQYMDPFDHPEGNLA